MLSETVETWGHSVIAVGDGAEALRVLQSADYPPLAILDWMMPTLDGIEVCRRLRQASPMHSIYLILLTARNYQEDIVCGLDAGADDYLTKPFYPPQMRARLNAAERIITLRENLAKQVVKLEEKIISHQKIESALRESQEYRNLFKHANDSIIVFDLHDQTVLNVNDKACEIYDIPRESFLGIALRLVAPDKERHDELTEILRLKGKSEEFEMIHLRSDNTPMNMLISSSIIEYQGREAILSINRDVTDRRLIERRMLHAVKEWSGTVDAISDAIILTDNSGGIRRCNRAAAAFFGEGFTDLIGENLGEKLWASSSGATAGVDAGGRLSAIENHNPLHEAVWEGKFTGRDDWFEISNHYVADSKGSDGDRVHIVKNITGRKQSEALLRRLNTAIEQAADSIVITDPSGVIQYVNPAFANTTGWGREEAVERKMMNLHAAELQEILPSGGFLPELLDKVWQGTFNAKKRSGEKYEEEITISPVKNEQGEILNYVAVSRDVTEKKRLESIAEAVNMMQNVGYVFSGIRHELGNPINSVKTALTVLLNNVRQWNTDQIIVYIERCLTEIGRVEYLLRSLKTFSMHEHPLMDSIPMTQFVADFLVLVADDFAKRGVQIKLSSTVEVGNARCDPRALHQVMLNLVTNAADALDDCDEPQIVISLARDVRRIYITVEDNGAGMSEQQVENLFKPFYTSKEKGTGLGLVIVKKMVAKMNGTITIESSYGIGTQVQLTLEAAESGSAAASI